jgi:hypothetical protein
MSLAVAIFGAPPAGRASKTLAGFGGAWTFPGASWDLWLWLIGAAALFARAIITLTIRAHHENIFSSRSL